MKFIPFVCLISICLTLPGIGSEKLIVEESYFGCFKDTSALDKVDEYAILKADSIFLARRAETYSDNSRDFIKYSFSQIPYLKMYSFMKFNFERRGALFQSAIQ